MPIIIICFMSYFGVTLIIEARKDITNTRLLSSCTTSTWGFRRCQPQKIFGIIGSVTSPWPVRSVGRLVGWSVCHNFLKGREDTLPSSYRGTCLSFNQPCLGPLQHWLQGRVDRGHAKVLQRSRPQPGPAAVVRAVPAVKTGVWGSCSSCSIFVVL